QLADGAHGSENARFQPGFALGGYRIETTVGEGGMGVVYRALDTKLNRPVAIKFLSRDVADEVVRRRFHQHAHLASAPNRPPIVTVHAVGEIDGLQYIVAEFVDGGTLTTWLEAEPRSWRQIVDLLAGVADAIAAAHAANILHRDIKPDNILVSRN